MHGLLGDNGNLEYGVGAILLPDRQSGKAAGRLEFFPLAQLRGMQCAVHFSNLVGERSFLLAQPNILRLVLPVDARSNKPSDVIA
jgi:hypothetical protein